MILRVDKDGFLINDGNIKNISTKLLFILKRIACFSKRELKNNFLSAYIRGSVSVGRFVENISDIDFVIITKTRPKKDNFSNFLEYSLFLDNKYKWVKGFDLFLVSKNDLLKSPKLNKLRIYLKTQSVLLSGIDFLSNLEKYKLGIELSKNLLKEMDNEFLFIKQSLAFNKDFLYNNVKRDINFLCVWMSRVVLRFSLYSSIPVHKKYSNDLSDCYKIVSNEYPLMEEDLKKALYWSRKPIDKKDVLLLYFNRVSANIKNIFKINLEKYEKQESN